jgi:hypothetical protein
MVVDQHLIGGGTNWPDGWSNREIEYTAKDSFRGEAFITAGPPLLAMRSPAEVLLRAPLGEAWPPAHHSVDRRCSRRISGRLPGTA